MGNKANFVRLECWKQQILLGANIRLHFQRFACKLKISYNSKSFFAALPRRSVIAL